MTEDEVRRRIDEIDEIADLIELAHIAEDKLYCDVLEAIASGAQSPAKLARAALQARHLSLDRYYSPPAN